MSARTEPSEEDSEKQAVQLNIDLIKSNIDKLDAFEEACDAIRKARNGELRSAISTGSKVAASDTVKPRKSRKRDTIHN
jgi:hypothetical protein